MTMNNDLRDKCTDIVLENCNNNSVLEQLKELKKIMKQSHHYAFNLSKSSKTSEEVRRTTTI